MAFSHLRRAVELSLFVVSWFTQVVRVVLSVFDVDRKPGWQLQVGVIVLGGIMTSVLGHLIAASGSLAWQRR